MKKISLKFLLIVGFALLYNTSIAQSPPDTVKITFAKMFPDAKNVSWAKVGPILWEGSFVYEGNTIVTKFAEDGTWIHSRKEVKIPNLPQNIVAAIKLKHPGWVIHKAKKIETAKEGIIYKVEIKKDLINKTVEYKEDGTAIAK